MDVPTPSQADIARVTWTQRIGLIPDGMHGHRSELDGWRGLAILLVLISHFSNANALLNMNLGQLGVHIFFVLSGVLMGHILFVKRTDLKTFYQRRFSRVFPLFWLYLTVVYGVGYLAGAAETTNFWYTLTFTRTYAPDPVWVSDLPIGHLWSLNIEEQAYLLMSALTFVFLRPLTAAAGLFVLGLASMYAYYIAVGHYTHIPHIRLHTELNLAWLFLPAAYAMVKHHTTRHIRPFMVWGAFIVGVACHHKAAPWISTFVIAPLCLAFVVNHLREAGQGALRCLRHPALRILGLWSFSIYIWQQPLYTLWIQPQAYPLFSSVLAVCLAIGLAALSFYAFENPLRRRINTLWTGRQ